MFALRWFLATLCLVAVATSANAQIITFDFESDLTFEAPGPLGFGQSVTQTVGSLDLVVNLGNTVNREDANGVLNTHLFQFAGVGFTNIGFQVFNNAVLDDNGDPTLVGFNLESIDFLNTNDTTEDGTGGIVSTLTGVESGATLFTATAAPTEFGGDLLETLSVDDSDAPLSDAFVSLVNISFDNSNGGLAFPGIDNIVISIPLAGDFNADGVVDIADFTVFRDNFGAADDSSLNDNGDGEPGVTVADFSVFVEAIAGPPAEGVAAVAVTVPEPATALLALCGFAAIAVRQKR